MSEYLAICFASLDVPQNSPERYTRCVALDDGDLGLGFGKNGEIVWKNEEDLLCDVLVSPNDRLLLRLVSDVGGVVVHRAGRSVVARLGKFVVLLENDIVEAGGKRWQVMIHGPAPMVHGPETFGQTVTREIPGPPSDEERTPPIPQNPSVDVRAVPPAPPPTPPDSSAQAPPPSQEDDPTKKSD